MSKTKVTRIACTKGENIFDALKRAAVSYSRIGGFTNNPDPDEKLVARVRVRTSESPRHIYAKK